MSKQSKAEVEAMIAALQNQLDEDAVTFPITRPDNRGNPKAVGCVENTEALLNHFGVTCRYNEMSKTVEIEVPQQLHKDKMLNDAIVVVRDLARKQGYEPAVAEENLGPISGANAYHPVRDWITGKQWDGKDRIEELLATVDTVEDDQYKRMLITKWLISAVALVMYDTTHQNDDHSLHGFKGVEGILVFKGKQGLGKTQWMESLVPPRKPWVKDAVTLDPHNKDSVLLAVSHWITELGEIDATFKKTDIAALKGFATQKSDKIRPAYAKTADTYARRTAFTGTVNDETFLAESGEHRRWWVLGVNSVNAKHSIDVQQLWAQVFDMYRECVPYWLTVDERQQLYKSNAKYERIDPLVEQLDSYVKNPLTLVGAVAKTGAETLGAYQIAERVLGRAINKAEANTTSKWLADHNFERVKESKRFRVRIDYAALQIESDLRMDRKYGTRALTV